MKQCENKSTTEELKILKIRKNFKQWNNHFKISRRKPLQENCMNYSDFSQNNPMVLSNFVKTQYKYWIGHILSYYTSTFLLEFECKSKYFD